jgi:hypothetical protein
MSAFAQFCPVGAMPCRTLQMRIDRTIIPEGGQAVCLAVRDKTASVAGTVKRVMHSALDGNTLCRDPFGGVEDRMMCHEFSIDNRGFWWYIDLKDDNPFISFMESLSIILVSH